MKKLVYCMMICVVMMVTTSTPTFGMAKQGAKIRIVHLSPGGPALDVLVDGRVATTNLNFKGTTNYLVLPGGNHHVEIYVAGTVASKKPIATEEVRIINQQFYTSAVVGLDPLQLITLTDSSPEKMKE